MNSRTNCSLDIGLLKKISRKFIIQTPTLVYYNVSVSLAHGTDH